MQRREFIAGLGAAALSLPAHAQQTSTPVIGYLSPGATVSRAFLEGLAETGYVMGRNVRIESRLSTVPETVADLIRSQVAVIYTGSSAIALAAKAVTSTISIVFGTGDDPVKLGLVASLNHPGGNLTGVTNNNVELEASASR